MKMSIYRRYLSAKNHLEFLCAKIDFMRRRKRDYYHNIPLFRVTCLARPGPFEFPLKLNKSLVFRLMQRA